MNGIVTTQYADGKPVSKETDYSNYGKNSKGEQSIGVLSKGMYLLQRMTKISKAQRQEVKDSNGQVVVTYEDGKFYNARGKSILEDKVVDLLNEKAYSLVEYM